MNEQIEPKDVKDLKPKRGRPKGSVDKEPRTRSVGVKLNTEPGDVSRITAFNAQWFSAPKVDIENKEEVENRIVDYLKACAENDMRPGVAGLCLALGIDRSTWWHWGAGLRRDYQDLVLRTKATMEAITEQLMIQGKMNPIPAIFILKNHFGYVDKNEVVLTPNQNPLGDTVDMEALKQKYLDNAQAFLPNEDSTDRLHQLETKYNTGGQNNE